MKFRESNCGSVDEQHFDVAIIGAGVAGSMAGILSARAGMRTLLLDRQSFPRSKVCGCCINGRALTILKQSGLESGLQRLHPTSTSLLAIRYRGRKLDVPMPASVAVSRRAMDQWLVEEAVASGCQFVDSVTVSVDPLPCEIKGNDSDPSRSAISDDADSPNERTMELRKIQIVGENEVSAATSKVFSKVVLVCDGLGHPSLHRLSTFTAAAQRGSRIGLGAVFPRTASDAWMQRGEILMAVAPHAYAGVVEIEDQQLNLAAAIDPSHLQESGSPYESLKSVFQSAGVPVPVELKSASIKGTVPLTRTAERIAGHRLFLLGDSTGYVEPFTGEGMAWALTAAAAVVPLVAAAVHHGWSSELATQWQSKFRSIVGHEQTICRILAAALRRPWLLPPILTTCQWFPSLTRRLVSQVNRIPEAMEIV